MAGLATEDVMAIIAGNQREERLFVQFDTRPVEDAKASAECGYQQFRDAEYVKIGVPGDPGNILHVPVTHCGQKRGCGFIAGRPNAGPENMCHVHRFPRQYAAFKGDLDQSEAAGLPLAAWSQLAKSEVEMLKAQRIHTVEQLAGVPDSALPNLGPIRAIRQRAIDFLEAAKGQAPLAKLRGEVEKRDEEVASLREIVEQMGRKIEELTQQKPGKSGKAA